MKKSKIYTKTGDKGLTSLIGGTRVPKNHVRLNAYGAIDELNSFLAMLRSQLTDEQDNVNILKIQNELFVVGGMLATEKEHTNIFSLSATHIEWLEEQIDSIDSQLPKLSNFVIPSDYFPAAICHVCRTVCRRSEREIYNLAETESVPEIINIYINRLSDYLFVLSRKISIISGKEDFFSNKTLK